MKNNKLEKYSFNLNAYLRSVFVILLRLRTWQILHVKKMKIFLGKNSVLYKFVE